MTLPVLIFASIIGVLPPPRWWCFMPLYHCTLLLIAHLFIGEFNYFDDNKELQVRLVCVLEWTIQTISLVKVMDEGESVLHWLNRASGAVCMMFAGAPYDHVSSPLGGLEESQARWELATVYYLACKEAGNICKLNADRTQVAGAEAAAQKAVPLCCSVIKIVKWTLLHLGPTVQGIQWYLSAQGWCSMLTTSDNSDYLIITDNPWFELIILEWSVNSHIPVNDF